MTSRSVEKRDENRRLHAPTPFTEKRVRDATCPAGKKYVLILDRGGKDSAKGLGLRVTASGTRRYIFEKRIQHGPSIRVKIGDPADWTLADARDRARELAVMIDKGRDPRIEASAERDAAEAERLEAARRDLIVEAVWREYIADRTPHWGDGHRRNHKELAQAGGAKKKRGKGVTKPGPLAALMPLKLSELTAERIAAWLKREAAKRPAVAAQAYRALRAFVLWTEDFPEYAGVVPSNACSARAVRDHVPRGRAKQDALQREQLPAWFAAVRTLPNQTISAYLQTLLLTGQRREVLASLRWADVDATWGSLTLRTNARRSNKGGSEYTIPLTPYVASLFSTLPRKNDFVFSSATAKGGRLVSPTRAHDAALEAAGLPHVTLHGLRRSFGSLAEWVEIPVGIVAQIQGHRPSATAEKHYRVRPLDLLRLWHTKFEAWILSEAKVPFTPPKAAGRLGVVGASGNVQPVA